VYPGTPSLAEQPINYFVHGANFGAMALDAALLSSAPYFFVYIWTSWLAYAIIYELFTITYSRAHGTDENGNVRGGAGCSRHDASMQLSCFLTRARASFCVLLCSLPSSALQPYVYAVVNWSTATGAASAGVLTGIIVFIIVPLLGLLAYCLVSLRRRHLDDDNDSSDGGDVTAGTPRGAKARSVIGDTALSCGSDEEAAETTRDDDVVGGGGGGKEGAAALGAEAADAAA
jgi:hypothetical protein